MAHQPNVVFILVDDLRWDDIAVAGHPFAETPAIDQLAREGTRFLNAFATTPLCSPSRAAILTGLYAHSNGIIDNTARDSASHRLGTFAIPLASAGYETGFFGKWHMGNDDTRRPGWTHWVAMKGQGEAINPKLNVDGERIEAAGYVTDVLTDYALRFMQRSQGRPFMVFLAHKALHPNVQQRDDGSVAQRPVKVLVHSRELTAGATPSRSRAGLTPRRRCAANLHSSAPSLAYHRSAQPPAPRIKTCAIALRCCSASMRVCSGSAKHSSRWGSWTTQ